MLLTQPPDELYESINSATKAARRMEDLSKRMLSTMAADLYNANEMNEYWATDVQDGRRFSGIKKQNSFGNSY